MRNIYAIISAVALSIILLMRFFTNIPFGCVALLFYPLLLFYLYKDAHNLRDISRWIFVTLVLEVVSWGYFNIESIVCGCVGILLLLVALFFTKRSTFCINTK